MNNRTSIKNLLLINPYPSDPISRFMLSGYILKGYLEKYYSGPVPLVVTVLDCDASDSPATVARAVQKAGPDWVGYSCYIWGVELALEVIDLLHEQSPNIIHILGGPEITRSWIETRRREDKRDYYVIGEGEQKLLRLVEYLFAQDGEITASLPDGVAQLSVDGVMLTENSETITNLDEIPSIYIEGVIDKSLTWFLQAFIETQRGCHYKCNYCVYPKFLPNINYYSLERITSELDHLIVERRVKVIRILDAVFPSDLERAKKVIKYLIKLRDDQELFLPWIFWEYYYLNVDEEFIALTAALKNRPHILNSEEMEPKDRPQHYSDMQRGYNVISGVGVQSFNTDSLRAVGRMGINKEKFGNFMELVRSHNIALKLDIILGLPYETEDSFFSGLEFFVPYFENTDHILNIHNLQILPGTELEEKTGEFGLEHSIFAPHTVFATPWLPKEEMIWVTTLSVVLFRTLNSPLRGGFFKSWKSSGIGLMQFLQELTGDIITAFPESGLSQGLEIDGNYMNEQVFEEITSEWLLKKFES
jgi:radical SAM superfamily enzyme YgiQ (UPF0313 family)